MAPGVRGRAAARVRCSWTRAAAGGGSAQEPISPIFVLMRPVICVPHWVAARMRTPTSATATKMVPAYSAEDRPRPRPSRRPRTPATKPTTASWVLAAMPWIELMVTSGSVGRAGALRLRDLLTPANLRTPGSGAEGPAARPGARIRLGPRPRRRPAADPQGHRLGPGGDAELGVDVVDVVLHRLGGEELPGRDLGVRHAGRHRVHDLLLADGEQGPDGLVRAADARAGRVVGDEVRVAGVRAG